MAKKRFRKGKTSKKSQSVLTSFLGIQPGEWVWCSECQRCYCVGEHKYGSDGFQNCHYEDCKGDALIDAYKWATVRFIHPEYPEIPERNTAYPCEIELGGVW